MFNNRILFCVSVPSRGSLFSNWQICRKTGGMNTCFRPLSGFSFLQQPHGVCVPWIERSFPSPLGVLFSPTEKDGFRESQEKVSVPSRGSLFSNKPYINTHDMPITPFPSPLGVLFSPTKPSGMTYNEWLQFPSPLGVLFSPTRLPPFFIPPF